MLDKKHEYEASACILITLVTLLVLGLSTGGCSGKRSASSHFTGSSPGEQQTAPQESAPSTEPEPPVETQPTTPTDPPEDIFEEGKIEVSFRPGVTEEQAREVIAAHGCTISFINTQYVSNPDYIGVILILPEGKDEEETVQEFLSDKTVEYAARIGVRNLQ